MSKHVCPMCGSTEFDDECIWMWMGKFYCSEKCCRRAVSSARG